MGFEPVLDYLREKARRQAAFTDPETGIELIAVRTESGAIVTQAGLDFALRANPQDIFSTGTAPALPTPPEPAEVVAEREALREAGFGQVLPPIARAPIMIGMKPVTIAQDPPSTFYRRQRCCIEGKTYAF